MKSKFLFLVFLIYASSFGQSKPFYFAQWPMNDSEMLVYTEDSLYKQIGNFSSTPYPIFTYVYTDSELGLLSYIRSGGTYDRNGNLIDTLGLLIPGKWPGEDSIYLGFGGPAYSDYWNGISYSNGFLYKLKLRADSTLEILPGRDTNLYTWPTGEITNYFIINHANERDYWLIGRSHLTYSDSVRFHVQLVDSTGWTSFWSVTTCDSCAIFPIGNTWLNYRMERSVSGDKFLLYPPINWTHIFGDSLQLIHYKFNRATGEITEDWELKYWPETYPQPSNLSPNSLHGYGYMKYSSDETKIYGHRQVNQPFFFTQQIWGYDISSSNSIDVLNSRTLVREFNYVGATNCPMPGSCFHYPINTPFGEIIILLDTDSATVSAILEPNNLNNPTFLYDYFPLKPFTNGITHCNYNNYLKVFLKSSVYCTDLPMKLWWKSLVKVDSVQWNISGPGGFAHYATGDTIYVPASQSGSYVAQLTYFRYGYAFHEFDTLQLYALEEHHLPDDTLLCPGDSLLLAPDVPGATVVWDHSDTAAELFVTTTGMYYFELINGPCYYADSIEVGLSGPPQLLLQGRSLYCLDETATFTLQHPEVSFVEWPDGSIAPSYSTTTSEWLYARYGDHCDTLSTDTLEIRFEDCNCIEQWPNVFSPNNDGVHDSFTLPLLCEPSEFELQVFNRWGARVYYSQNPQAGWDGTVNGAPAAEGTYFYTAKWRHPLGKLTEHSAHLTLFR